MVRKRPPILSYAQRQGRFRTLPKKQTGLPAGWQGTLSEWLVFRELTDTYKQKAGDDFTFQTRLSTTGGLPGRLEIGGLIADFLFEARFLIITPLSEYSHYRIGPGAILDEAANRLALTGMGYTVIYIDSDPLLKDPSFYVGEALQQRDYSRLAQGLV